MKEYTLKEIQGKDLLVIRGKVVNVKEWKRDHPGGLEVIELLMGEQDATEQFDEIAHSPEAKKIVNSLVVGTLKGAKVEEEDLREIWDIQVESKPKKSSGFSWSYIAVPIIISIALLVVRSRVK